MKLTIEHLAAYSPYEVIFYGSSDMWKMTGLSQEHIYICNGIYSGHASFEEINTEYSLLLRPLSDLTKEIEHNGERFVPIERLFLPEINISAEDIVIIGDSVVFRGLFQDKILSTLNFNFMNYKYVQKLLSWHFNIFKLPETLYIKYSDIT